MTAVHGSIAVHERDCRCTSGARSANKNFLARQAHFRSNHDFPFEDVVGVRPVMRTSRETVQDSGPFNEMSFVPFLKICQLELRLPSAVFRVHGYQVPEYFAALSFKVSLTMTTGAAAV
jgi:hypothetical protein